MQLNSESEHTWTFGKRALQLYCQETPAELTAPKPDLFFSFHAYMQGDPECGPLTGDDYIENFGVTCLSKLYEDYLELSKHHDERPFGFVSSPCKEFYDEDSFKDRTCFPWAVCEWKHQGHIGTAYESFLHCQAANAAAVCLTFFANAASGGGTAPDLHDIRPVVCMTFTGPKTRVWVAYVTEVEDGRYRYVRSLRLPSSRRLTISANAVYMEGKLEEHLGQHQALRHHREPSFLGCESLATLALQLY
jgi:hypothetical protein